LVVNPYIVFFGGFILKCKYCESLAVFHRKISNEYVCKTHFIISIEKKILRTIRKYKMISPKEKIAVGVSGGKDSLALLYNIKKIQEKHDFSPKVEAILIDEGIFGYREESVNIAIEMCQKWEIPLHIVSFKDDFGQSLDEIIAKPLDLGMNACTMCGTIRRRLLNQKAKDIMADKLAIGHNLDDQAETFLQNVLRNDLERIVQHPPSGNPKDPLDKYVVRIKPLMHIPEEEITLYCYYLGIPIQSTPCPYSENYFILRKSVQTFLNELEKHSPEIKYNLLKANEIILKKLDITCNADEDCFDERNVLNLHQNLKICPICGSAMGQKRQICFYCELKRKLQ